MINQINNSNNLFIYAEKKKKLACIRKNFKIDFQVRWNTTYEMLKRFILLKPIVNDITTNADSIPNLSEAQKKRLHKLIFSVNDWNTISLVTNSLSPFYDATIQLQKSKFPILSHAKLIEVSLFEFFQTKARSLNGLERWMSRTILENLDRYLVVNTTNNQKADTSVIFYLPIFQIQITFFN